MKTLKIFLVYKSSLDIYVNSRRLEAILYIFSGKEEMYSKVNNLIWIYLSSYGQVHVTGKKWKGTWETVASFYTKNVWIMNGSFWRAVYYLSFFIYSSSTF